MNSTVLVSSKKQGSFKRRMDLSHNPKTLKVPGLDEPLFLKVENERVKWSTNGKKFRLSLRECPVSITELKYPKIEMKAPKKSSEIYGYNYYLIDRKFDSIIDSHFSKKKIDLNEKKAKKFFSRPVYDKYHLIKIVPVTEKLKIASQSDPEAAEYLSLLKDKRLGILLGIILSFWVLNSVFQYFFSSDKKEATLIQVAKKEQILKEREEISKLLSFKGSDQKNQRISKKQKTKIGRLKKAPKVKVPNKRKSADSRSHVAKKGKLKTSPVKSATPSLKDRLFSRKIKKGSIGRASKTAKTTLRGSRSGSIGATAVGSAKGIRGGFSSGKGSGISSSLSKRSNGGSGSLAGIAGGGMGSLGSRVMLSGKGANVSGGLTREQISKVVRRNKKDINRCYESRLQFSPNLSGKVVMQFSIDRYGRVARSSTGSSTARDKALESCMARKIKKWKFDKPINGRTVKVSFPFNLSFNKRG